MACVPPRLEQLALRDREQHADRILADHGGQHARIGADDVARRDGGAADAAVDRRLDLGVGELDLGVAQLGLGILELRLGLELLATAAGRRSTWVPVLVRSSSAARLSCTSALASAALAASRWATLLVDRRLVGLGLDGEQDLVLP